MHASTNHRRNRPSLTTRSARPQALAFAALALALALVACQRGPGRDRVRRDVQQRLDRDFKAGLFKVAQLERRGHYPYNERGSGEGRLAVYYNATLELQRSYHFSKWDQLNVGSLLSLLGAAKKGIDGVAAEGNKKGDRLVVRGLTAYAPSGDGFRSVPFVPAAAKKSKGLRADKEQRPHHKRLKELGRMAAYFQSHKRSADLAHLNQQLANVVAASRRREAKAKGWVSLATGASAGEYYRQGSALAALLVRAKAKVRAFETKGSIENCELVAAREVEFAYAQNDIAHAAHAGADTFSGQPPLSALRAVAALYPEAVQVVVRKGSGLKRLTALRGKRVNIGPAGSGMRSNALQVLAAAGLQTKDLGRVGLERSWTALERLGKGELDAVFLTSSYPNRGLYRFAERSPVDLIPLDEETIGRLRTTHPYLQAIVLPANTYRGMAAPRRTVHVTAMLVTHAQTPPARVKTLLEQLYANVAELSKGSLQAYLISRKTALSGVSIPLHPEAAAFFGAAGASKR